MPKLAADEIARDLFNNLRSLASQIARKPAHYDPRWAKSINEAFSLYTRTSTVNYFVSLGDLLREWGWPFPAYMDLEDEIQHSRLALKFTRWPSPFYQIVSLYSTNLALLNISVTQGVPESTKQKFVDLLLSRRFHKESQKVFKFWKAHPLLQSKRLVVSDLEQAYRAKLWGACIPSILPLIDYLMREYFQTDDLLASIGTLVQAFKLANLTPESFKPGYGVYDNLGMEGHEPILRVDDCVEKDLRIPGVYLTSFADFAYRYYSLHKTASNPDEINRHAVIHGDMQYWSKEQTTKVLMFFDLVIKLGPVLQIISGTKKASD